ncbi:MAG TPA: hypothetical protein VD969_03345 [Symbiobacteriaceae bacterium]|nr:hypothetical protein [Symbiobacteriaceae bacterium]
MRSKGEAIWVLFSRFKLLGSWTMWETLLLYAVASGDFHRILLRPRSTVLQV